MVFTDTGMYPHGFVPTKTAIFANFKSYKNRLDGIFFRNVFNSRVEGGVFADNRYQADFDRSDSIVMNGTRLIGSTARYREILSTQEVWVDQDRIVGLELHPLHQTHPTRALLFKTLSLKGSIRPTSVSIVRLSSLTKRLTIHGQATSTIGPPLKISR